MIVKKTAVVNQAGEFQYDHYTWWCPGCQQIHIWQVGGPTSWEFDGNMEKPTVSPSILTHVREDRGCHVFIVAGMIQFLPDSWHGLKGMTIPMAELPDWV